MKTQMSPFYCFAERLFVSLANIVQDNTQKNRLHNEVATCNRKQGMWQNRHIPLFFHENTTRGRAKFDTPSNVELVGFEPTSKQGNHTLSTRLFRPSVFVLQQDPDHQLQPYPLKFHPGDEARPRLFPIYLHRLVLRFGTTSLERCLVLASNAGIKPIYYTSIRQRERSCFRQLNF